uniref:Uncharacterized protein n=1 Tax=Globodera rostochiensis TaxID=31243 RepID=A0A914HL60_GLORO
MTDPPQDISPYLDITAVDQKIFSGRNHTTHAKLGDVENVLIQYQQHHHQQHQQQQSESMLGDERRIDGVRHVLTAQGWQRIE